MGTTIELKAADGHAVSAYMGTPQGRPRGGLVVLQEVFGVNAHIRAVVDAYVQEGYATIAPDMFSRVAPGTELTYSPANAQLGTGLKKQVEELGGAVLQDIQAAVDQVRSAGKVATVGFCWGGLQSWRAACGASGLSAAVMYYGGGVASPAEIGKTPRVPVLAHYGEKDHLIPMADVQAFRAAHPEVQVHLYPCGHAFNCDLHAAFDPEASALARARTLAFLERHLGASPG